MHLIFERQDEEKEKILLVVSNLVAPRREHSLLIGMFPVRVMQILLSLLSIAGRKCSYHIPTFKAH